MDNLPVGAIEAQAKKAMAGAVKERYQGLSNDGKTNGKEMAKPMEYNSKDGSSTPGGK